MARLNHFYPQRPWPFSNLANHPAFMRMQRESSAGYTSSELYFGLAHIASLPAWAAGGTLAGFMTTFGDRAEPMLNELLRMNVFELDTSGMIPQLLPCTGVAEHCAAQGRSRAAGFYLTEKTILLLKREASARNRSQSQIVEQALEAFLGEASAT